jgi:HEAT repeat protein
MRANWVVVAGVLIASATASCGEREEPPPPRQVLEWGDRPEDRAAAARSMMEAPTLEDVRALRQALCDPDANVRFWSARALARGVLDEETKRALENLALDEREMSEIRTAASFALGRRGDRR